MGIATSASISANVVKALLLIALTFRGRVIIAVLKVIAKPREGLYAHAFHLEGVLL